MAWSNNQPCQRCQRQGQRASGGLRQQPGFCRLELKHEDDWGTGSDDNSASDGLKVATIACEQLACDGANAEVKQSFGGGSGSI